MKVMVSYSYLAAITINIIDHDLKGYAFFFSKNILTNKAQVLIIYINKIMFQHYFSFYYFMENKYFVSNADKRYSIM
jgi:hypothetical protein